MSGKVSGIALLVPAVRALPFDPTACSNLVRQGCLQFLNRSRSIGPGARRPREPRPWGVWLSCDSSRPAAARRGRRRTAKWNLYGNRPWATSLVRFVPKSEAKVKVALAASHFDFAARRYRRSESLGRGWCAVPHGKPAPDCAEHNENHTHDKDGH